jgi:low affinity Fe/Cu permease
VKRSEKLVLGRIWRHINMAMWIGIGHFHHDPLEKKVDNYTKEIGEDGEHHMSHPS